MSERYSRLYALPGNLYAETSPVIIAAGALLKDNQTGNVLAQLKLRSISDKNIKAVTVSISAFDTFDAPLGEPISYQYLDMNAARNAEFGAKKPIFLPDATTRKFSAAITSVAFADNSVWKAGDAPWEPLPAREELETALEDPQLVTQYRIKYGKDCSWMPREHKDLWYCACGALNRQDEAKCHACGNALADLRALDLDALRAERDERFAAGYRQLLQIAKESCNVSVLTITALKFDALGDYQDSRNLAAYSRKRAAEEQAKLDAEAERQRIAREKAEKAAEARAKKAKKIAVIVAALAAVTAAVALLITKVIIPNSRYNAAVKLKDAGQYEEAIAAFEAMEGYKDSAEKITDCERLTLKNAQVGDYVFFGAYEQDNDPSNGNEAIEWLVLEVKDGKTLLISKYVLDCKQYNTSRTDITWETCTLRQWLNNDFINSAFSADDQAMIPTVTVSADKNPKYGTNPGNATQDQVFLLSIAEVNQYFSSDTARQCKPTEYAVANGVYVNGDNSNCWWWLRSPGNYQHYAAGVYDGGAVDVRGRPVNYDLGAVRPALWVDLDS